MSSGLSNFHLIWVQDYLLDWLPVSCSSTPALRVTSACLLVDFLATHEYRNVPAYLVDGPDEIREEWLQGKRCAGVTAGASAPESLVQAVVEKLGGEGVSVSELSGPKENISFSLPARLR